MPNFGDLPPEVLDHILSFLAVVEPPSSAFLYEQPSTSMVKSDFQPLKNLSRTCQSMRCCTFKNLFKHTKVRLTAEYLPESQARARIGDVRRRGDGVPGRENWDDAQMAHISRIRRLFFCIEDVTDFLSFVEVHHLGSNVESVLFYVLNPDPNPGFDRADHLLEPLLHKIVQSINPEILMILAPPSVMADLARVGADMRDAWAFDMPLHALRFRQPANLSGPAALARSLEYGSRRPWRSILYNEGSFLKAYSTYEYFSKTTPSLLTLGCMCRCSILGDPSSPPLLQLGKVRHTMKLSKSMHSLALDPWDRLQIFDFVVRFPLHTHVSSVLYGLYHCASIVTLRTKLASHSDSDIWNDPAITSIHADLWMEFEESYRIIFDVVQKMGDARCLQNFTTLDYASPGKGIIDDLIRQHPLIGWDDREEGWWARRISEDQN